jgi:hypothetical protein
MLDAGQKQTLLVSLAPYLCLALYDTWLHERARRVPAPEQALHGVSFVSFVVLMAGLFLGYPGFVWPAIAGFGVASLLDELGFHGGLPRRERGLHFAAYACFAGFAAVAYRMEALP